MEKSRLHIPLLFGLGRDPWPSHHVSHSAGHGGQLGPRRRRDRRAHGRDRSSPRRDRLGLLADGGHRARSALGPHCRVERRRPLPRLGDGARLGQGLSAGRSFQAGFGCRLREAFCSLRRGHRRARLQRRGHERDHAAAGLPGAIPRRGRSGRGHGDELLQLHQRNSRHGQPVYADPDFAQRVGV